MAKRGRKTVADFMPVVPGYKEPVHPPPDLDEAERKIWFSITSTLPPDWFACEAQPLLTELCRHISIANELMADLALVRKALAAFKGDLTLEPDRLRRKRALMRERESLLKSHGYQSQRIGDLATKLRLTNQSKTVPELAEKRAREMQPVGQRPWKDWKEEIISGNGST